jgi:hypothetical protein
MSRTAIKNYIDSQITSKVAENSIPPTLMGATLKELLDLTLNEANAEIEGIKNLAVQAKDDAEAAALIAQQVETNLQPLIDDLAKLLTIESNLTELLNLEGDLTELLALENKLTELLSIEGNLSELLNLESNLADVLTVEGALADIQTVSTNIAAILTIEGALNDLLAIQSNLTELLNIESNLTQILNVNASLVQILAVEAALTQIQAIFNNLAEILNVEANIGDIVICANNIAAIIAAPAAATNAANSALAAQAAAQSILPQTGTLPVTYDVSYIYGDAGAPLTGNITDDQTGAVVGLVQKLYHQQSTIPTFPATYVNIGAVGYVVNELNIIYIEYVSATRIEYWIAFEL